MHVETIRMLSSKHRLTVCKRRRPSDKKRDKARDHCRFRLLSLSGQVRHRAACLRSALQAKTAPHHRVTTTQVTGKVWYSTLIIPKAVADDGGWLCRVYLRSFIVNPSRRAGAASAAGAVFLQIKMQPT